MVMFKLSDEQFEKFHAWRAEQEKLPGYNGDMNSFTFTPGQGFCLVEVKNLGTGQSIDLTDYEDE